MDQIVSRTILVDAWKCGEVEQVVGRTILVHVGKCGEVEPIVGRTIPTDVGHCAEVEAEPSNFGMIAERPDATGCGTCQQGTECVDNLAR